MNKLLTYSGSQPIYLGDIDFMQAAASEVFVCLTRALVNSQITPNAILQGVALTSPILGTVSWSGGVVVIDGEILPVEPGSISVGSEDSLYFHVESTLSGGRTFKDGQIHQCYDTRKAVLSTVSTDGISYNAMNANRLRLNSKTTYNVNSYSSAMSPNSMLRVLNGLLYLDASFSVAGIAATGEEVGYVEFAVLPLEQNVPFTKSFNTPGVYLLQNGAAHVIPLEVTVAATRVQALPTYDRVRIEIEVPPIPVELGEGTGSLNGIIPIL